MLKTDAGSSENMMVIAIPRVYLHVELEISYFAAPSLRSLHAMRENRGRRGGAARPQTTACSLPLESPFNEMGYPLSPVTRRSRRGAVTMATLDSPYNTICSGASGDAEIVRHNARLSLTILATGYNHLKH